jgi:hypothetical protein
MGHSGKLWTVVAGTLLSVLCVTCAFALNAAPAGKAVLAAGDQQAGASKYYYAQGSFTRSHHSPVYWYWKSTRAGKCYGYSYSGTIMSRGGVKASFYRCRYRGVQATTTSDLVVVRSTMIIKNGVTFRGKYLHGVASNYYYYIRLQPAVSGKTGTYTVKWRYTY